MTNHLKLLHDKPKSTLILTASESITHMDISFNYILQNTFYSDYRILMVLVQLSTKGLKPLCRFFWLTSTLCINNIACCKIWPE